MFATLSHALKRGLQAPRRRTRSAPVVTELEGRALTAALVPHQAPYLVVGGVPVTLNSFVPGGASHAPAATAATHTAAASPTIPFLRPTNPYLVVGGVPVTLNGGGASHTTVSPAAVNPGAEIGGHIGKIFGSLGSGGRYGGSGGIFM